MIFRKIKKKQNLKNKSGFFDDYPEFFNDESINSYPNRLNQRFHALISNNIPIIEGKRILDLAAHDGRWSFAALQHGAQNVHCIEIDNNAIKRGNEIMEKFGILKDKYQFTQGNLHQEIEKIQSNSIDTVFCFGFLYHTLQHMQLFNELKRLNPTNIIIDTDISRMLEPIIYIKTERANTPIESLVGWLSQSALEMILKHIGYSFSYYDWHKQNIENWEHLGDYKEKTRITMTAKKID